LQEALDLSFDRLLMMMMNPLIPYPLNWEIFTFTIFSCGSYYRLCDDSIQHLKHTIPTVNAVLPKENKASCFLILCFRAS